MYSPGHMLLSGPYGALHNKRAKSVILVCVLQTLRLCSLTLSLYSFKLLGCLLICPCYSHRISLSFNPLKLL